MVLPLYHLVQMKQGRVRPFFCKHGLCHNHMWSVSEGSLLVCLCMLTRCARGIFTRSRSLGRCAETGGCSTIEYKARWLSLKS